MVLIINRAAGMALLTLLPIVAVQAQRNPGATEIRIGERPVLFGFALGCVECTPGEGARGRVGGGGRASQVPVWSYRSYPQVEDVIPGAAAERAGVRKGDILMSIDGLSLLSDEGTRRMSAATAGEVVRLTFNRDSHVFDVSLKLGPTTGGRGSGGQAIVGKGHMMARIPTPQGNVEIDLWSDDAVRLTRDSTGAMIMRIGDAVLRLWVPEALRDTTRDGRGGGAGERGRGRPEP
jgi:membrane-associated protease RseP (regulator of RpoE activity)